MIFVRLTIPGPLLGRFAQGLGCSGTSDFHVRL
jgi:hypothetical protein